jgi:O-antigen biosynthesis protein
VSRVLVVTGMHRSGTSLVANYLQKCGLDMGDELLPADVGNPLGYYEDVLIHDLHRELLWKAGVEDAFTVSEGDLPIAVDPVFKERARDIAARREHKAQWGWKEPRTALFLDMWDEVLSDAAFLFVLRRPLAVLDSLLRRAANPSITQSPERALEMWRLYNTEMLRFSERRPDRCVWVETEAFARNAEKLAAALGERFGFELSARPVADVLVDDAYHRNVRMRAKMLASRNRGEAKACEVLYDRLREKAIT